MNFKTEINGLVGIATLNRPEALNALNTALLNELADTLEAWDRGNEVRCMIVTGSERAEIRPGVKGWKAQCDNGSAHLIEITPDGTAKVTSRTD